QRSCRFHENDRFGGDSRAGFSRMIFIVQSDAKDFRRSCFGAAQTDIGGDRYKLILVRLYERFKSGQSVAAKKVFIVIPSERGNIVIYIIDLYPNFFVAGVAIPN